ncbi:NAD-dependent deacetylase [Chloroflexota bacterium]
MKELVERAAMHLLGSNYAIALTGAGISTESGIPDFRGPDGIWTKHPEAEREAYEHYEELLSDPKRHWGKILEPDSMFSVFDKFIECSPNSGHISLAQLEKMGILKAIITQNADALHQKAGSRNVIEYHGSMAKLRCMSCGLRFARDEFDLQKLRTEGRLPPLCPGCNGVLKIDGVYFREPIPSDSMQQSQEEAGKCDLMLICGTSAVVYPFAELPRIARNRMSERGKIIESSLHAIEWGPALTIIEINAETTPLTYEGVSDYLIQGKTGEVLPCILEEVTRVQKG